MNYQFSTIIFKPNALVLVRGDQSVDIDKQTATLLLLLIENANIPVSRHSMVETIWQGKVVSDAAISSAIRRLRKALAELDSEQTFVKTIPKVGYQWQLGVCEAIQSEDAETSEHLVAERLAPINAVTRLRLILSGSVLAAVLLLLAYWQTDKRPVEVKAVPPAFTQAWHLWVQKREELLPKSVDYLEQALQQDPDFFEAHNMLAHIYSFKMSRHMGLSDDEIVQRAQRHIQAAEKLAPGNINSRIARAMLNLFYLRNLSEVDVYLNWAEEQNNCSALCHFLAAHASYVLKKTDRMIFHAEKAYAIQPDHVLYIWERAWAQFMAGNYEQALVRTQEAEHFISRTSHIIRAMIAQAQGSNELSLTHWIRYYQNKKKLTKAQAQDLQGKFVTQSNSTIALELMSLVGDIPPDQKINLYLIAKEKEKALATILNTKGRQDMTYILGAEMSPIFTNAYNNKELKKIGEHLWGQ
ncbi:winged helix-turn-helix domain-containing protein [Gilvimarinus sp. 1_MG-2023]|uniref:winged helix-turn-helix domain-containing protein n=1 Tax=Gilvimarinus sp. 1_MG-2023 TaxID=3062638 RepID=UPI0026E14F09|nr:winged helix-turn-helix domain-containing protein [Gilvimarinus sp. 1_MG-2023]MDO6748146.1 winged helix-turn-helix domain-containing protein [Gilvimarinus sp. 1_MG-2023]